MKALRRLAYVTLTLAYLQVVFGAIVRITGSGLGCGDHWPDCYGSFTPVHRGFALLIEISHRYGAAVLSTAVAALVFLALLAGILVIYAIPRGYQAMQKRDDTAMQQANARRAAAENNLATAATGVSRLTRETERVGQALFTTASLPFEIASLLLLVAIIGSVMLARTLKQEMAADDVDQEVLKEIDAASSKADES